MEKWSIGKSATLTDLSMLINEYRVRTVGLYACIHVGVKINDQLIYPDMIVMINFGRHKQCYPDFENNYFVGPPNFVLDIHENSSSPVIKERKQLFASSGVREYLIVNEGLSKIEWNRLEKGKYKKVKADKEGFIKSTSLPGLWMDISALKRRDNWATMAGIEHGLSRREHHELMDSIWNKN